MKPLAFTLFIITCLIALLWAPSCANIIPPAGGPRDTLPPVILSVLPADSTLNFNSDRIVIEFDEYVDLQDVQNNVLFTPTFERNPEIAVKGKTITVRFRDPLEENTTYTLSFGNSIRDINENNILPGYTYSFSTGPAMDSLEIAGRVILAQNGKIDSTLTIVLHRDLTDSAVIKKRPPYVTRMDARGNFRFRNLPKSEFAVYAIGNAGIARRYQNKNQLFAFLDSPVVAGQADSLLLYAYREAEAAPPIPSVNLRSGSRDANQRDRLIFATNLNNNQQDLLKDLSLNFQTVIKTYDSSLVRLTIDSTFTDVDFSSALDSTSKILSVSSAWIPGTQYHLILGKEFATDTLGQQLLKTDTLSFTTRKAEDYGSLTVKVQNPVNFNNPVLQIVQNDKVIMSIPLVNGIFTSARFIPGEYELRILEDRNNNVQWDPGEFFNERKQPEIAKPASNTITVKANWANEFNVSF